MSKGAYDVFILVINFLGSDWQPKHVTIGLFEAITTTRQALVWNLIELLDKYALKRKNIVYVKDEGLDFNAMTALTFVVSCECFGLEETFQGNW